MSKYEEYLISILKKSKVSFQREKTFKDLKHGLFRFDFYISNFQNENFIIEVDGEQHFKPIYGRAALLKSQEHDRRKNSYCLANNIKLYRIPYWEINQIKTFSDMTKNKYLVKSKWHSDFLKVPH